MVIELVVATRNTHKTREIQQILGSDFRVRDLGAYPEVSEIRETGTSFEENAKLKALAASTQLPGLLMADDSGLEVDALGGEPGIYSARYAGANATEKDKIDKLLRELVLVRIDGEPIGESRFRPSAIEAGFVPGYRGLVLRRANDHARTARVGGGVQRA